MDGVAGEEGEEAAGWVAGEGGNIIGGEEEKVKVGAFGLCGRFWKAMGSIAPY